MMKNWAELLNTASQCKMLSTDAIPELAIIPLPDLVLTTLVGDDTVSYLQGQVTCDVTSIEKGSVTQAAHCDPKGKMWSNFRLFHFNDGLAYILHRSVAEKQLTELKKYAVFSKIAIEHNEEIKLFSIAGSQAKVALNDHISEHDVTPYQSGVIVKIDATRYLVALPEREALTLINSLDTGTVSSPDLWQLLEIQAGIPQIEASTSAEYLPQALNLEQLGGISYEKGCYTGQEMVARAKFRGANKRAMYLLMGTTTQSPVIGTTIQRSVGENWRKGGILSQAIILMTV
ncbi:tRNA-modifying protein YgfZ [Vibrio sp. SS-MA-C1-2]|uniref:tRNA-modifying protein YgfZ n=1 Tax=Vibrio sp. SS-MA-C1-2 TaxID=2908646 RepID=UPI001F1889F2|nr:tRNA-modifying protein YgfZ [Vibrio sp. SS-MA-C1-2]UJF19040.1 tRNA-modifying protein YgfZ [Vibrio sp. SS-MA-C1-2]